MPNHFHLLVKQKTKAGMTKLLRKLSTTYALYFNRRYERVGHLFQSVYKAVLITEDPYLLHVSRYIHLNPAELTRKIPSGPVALLRTLRFFSEPEGSLNRRSGLGGLSNRQTTPTRATSTI